MSFVKGPSVAIVGGGVAGLLALKRLRDEGLDPVLFEATAELGGIWAKHCMRLYPSLHANTARTWMHFADFEFEPPAGEADFPHHSALTAQLLAFVERFNLQRSCRLSSPVHEVRESSTRPGTFEIQVCNEYLHFDRVCLCTGKVHEDNVPSSMLVDSETLAFHSSVLDQHQYSFSGKHVVIIGFGAASAADVCELAAPIAASVTVVSQQPIFLAPRMDEASGQTVMAKIRCFSTLVPDVLIQAQMRKTLYRFPTHSNEEFTLGLHYATPCWNLHKLMAEGKVVVRLTSLKECRHGQALFLDGSTLAADVLVWCTGYRSKVFSVLERSLLAKVEPSMPLYETVWAPHVPGLAVMGQGFAFWWLLELQAQWIARVWSDRARLPPARDMQTWIEGVTARRNAVQSRLPRERPYMFPESVVAAGVRLAKHIGSWPGVLSVMWRGRETFEPRFLYTVPRSAL